MSLHHDMDPLETIRNRVYALEISQKRFTERLDHLDSEVEKMRTTMESNMRTWDRRWWIAIGMAAAGALVTGGGTVSLKAILNAFGH